MCIYIFIYVYSVRRLQYIMVITRVIKKTPTWNRRKRILRDDNNNNNAVVEYIFIFRRNDFILYAYHSIKHDRVIARCFHLYALILLSNERKNFISLPDFPYKNVMARYIRLHSKRIYNMFVVVHPT